ncbi:MAG: RagB/SusD family nutrient uptake outer membrane protein [Bacteroidales bacterium]|nr:RagB/SusD family nutrient uptake outer membrane protein [Bacteroidales bacterium]MDD2424411.1 RagB/SusD family nutrient uptake outer membrane protein [Bacteroidales bacterium]MDD3988993.1 RagB/SusD family nutrient uptake outer membrane protein [Bacteroidales bacterium]MDD4638382.1 RagB/SusD family nutrient uptake outer membrane protein [Bacteroidales bacterium]
MKNSYIITLLLIVATALSSCDKFLDVKPKGVFIPEKVADFEGILNSPTLLNTFPINLLGFTDDNFNSIDKISQNSTTNGYLWRSVITVNEKDFPDVWGPLYRAIYNCNVIIGRVLEASEGTEARKQSVFAEAKVIRAGCYLTMLTVFSKAYNSSTAATDPGLPLVTSINVTDKVPGRSSLKATLDYIIDDVKSSIDALPATNVNRYRVSKYSAYGLLARIYLYMADYANAEIYVDLALQAPNCSMLNYNDYTSSYSVPEYDLNPEILWQISAVGNGSPAFMLYSDDLKSYFNDDDIRYTFLTVTNNNGLGRSSFSGTYNFGITLPEMYLTKAELLARKGSYNEAMNIVNTIRQKRIMTSAYTDQSATSGEDALAKVFAERRRELAYCGLRWFDMKRLDQEGRMPEIRRIDPETQEVLASLPPHSPKYTFEIPVRVQMFNPDMVLNHPND